MAEVNPTGKPLSLPVEVVTQAKAEEADLVVCVYAGEEQEQFKADNIYAPCADSGRPLPTGLMFPKGHQKSATTVPFNASKRITPMPDTVTPERLTPDVEVLKSDATKYLAVTTAITTAAEYSSSADTLRAGKAFVERVDQAFQPLIDSIQESLKQTKTLRDSITGPVKDHRRMIETARDQFEQRQAAAHARANAEMPELAKQVQDSDQEALSAMGPMTWLEPLSCPRRYRPP